MGLAASQARLLSITQRISDNELRAQLINNQKMRLNSESSKVSENYINALNKTNLVFANYDSEDKAQNVPLTFKNLTAFNQYNNQYNLTNTAGNVLISEDDANKYKASGGNLEDFLAEYGIVYTTSYWDTITDQLHKCEAFYTTPNQTGIVENLKYDETNKKWTSDIDGEYAFFEAEQLRKMYEGENGAKYEDTVKTSDYVDFAKYYDLFYDKLAKYNKDTKKQNILIENFVYNLQEKTGDLINASQITVNSDRTLSTTATQNLSAYFDGASTINLNDYVKNITASSLGFTEFGGKWTKDQDWQNILNVSINKNTHEDTTPNQKALYFQNTNDSCLYVQIMGAADENDDGVNETSYWLNTSNNKIYSYNGSSFDELPDDDTSTAGYQQTTTDEETGATITLTTSATWDDTNKIASWTEAEGSASETTLVKYPDSSTSNNVNAPKFELDFTNTVHKQIVQDLAADYVNNTLYPQIIKDLLTNGAKAKKGTGLLTDEEIEKMNTPVASSTDLTTVVDALEKLLGVDIGNDTDKMMGILDALSTGVNLVESVDAAGKIIYTIPTVMIPDSSGNLNALELKGNAVNLSNALVCDTMMNYFGEPVYGYMKENANGELIVADEEAQWYTNLFDKIKSCGFQVLADGLASSTDWMQFALENGIVVMEQINSEQNWQPITHTSCSDILEQTDTQAATLAEAEYNKAMRQIEAKDEMFDLELKNIDTEHATLESEYESVKKAMTGNIERTFQMYG